MSKKKKIVLILVVVTTIATAFLGGSSFSKYAAQVQGNAIADVANWSFKVNENTEQMATIKLTSQNDDGKIIGNKIAPGTHGSFDIVIDASEAEVGIDYKIEIQNEQNVPKNMTFTHRDVIFNNLKEIEKYFHGTIDANSEEKVKTFTINWDWPYTTGDDDTEIANNDKQDTIDGGAGDYSCDIVVSGTQVKPQV